EQEWGIAVGDAFTDATEAFVAEATRADGTAAVLKLVVPRSGDAARNEIAVLRLTGGEGCVRLLRDDVERGALLLERLGRSLYELALPIRARHGILCSTVARVWRPAPGCGLPTGAPVGTRHERASTRGASGSGASSSVSPPACSARRWACSRSAGRCSPLPIE